MKDRTIFLTGTILGGLAVVLGALGAHALKAVISAEAVDTFETGVKYQMYHAILLLVLACTRRLPSQLKRPAYWLVTVGVCCFSLSIYLLATNALTGFDFRVIGFVTPLGGMLLIAGWATLGYACLKGFDR